MTLATLPEAAQLLGTSVPTIRRWLRDGAPIARRGRRGRGGHVLVDVDALAVWRASPCAQQPVDHRELIVLASELPEIVAEAVAEAFREIEGPHKHLMAGALAGAWYVVTVALLDRLRRDVPELRDPVELPRKIDQLRSICAGFVTKPSS